MKGDSRSRVEIQQYLNDALAEVRKRSSTTAITTETMTNRLITETGGFVNGRLVDPGRNKAGATGIGQMFPPAVHDAHKFLYGKTLTKDELAATYKKVTDDPKLSILYATALYALLEKQIRGLLRSKGIRVNDDAAIRSMVSAAYHLGLGNFKGNSQTPAYGGVESIIDRANTPAGSFTIQKFVDIYNQTARGIGQPNDAVGKEVGISSSDAGSAGTSRQTVRWENHAPSVSSADKFIPLSYSVADSVPTVPQRIIKDGLDNQAWFDKGADRPGGLVGNPHLRQLDDPAWFELRLNQSDGSSLSDSKGNPLQVKLNVSLQSVNIKSQHIVERTPTATGLMITFWGSQPDTIVGRGTTGLFMNPFGLTAFMSSKGRLGQNGLLSHVARAFSANNSSEINKLLSADETLRVAAQDAFMEFTALFKNNGVTRFLPYVPSVTAKSMREAVVGPDGKPLLPQQTAQEKNTKVWSPTAGATGFQMMNRAGDVNTRGYVAFKYKGQTYLGYFKGMNFSADAKAPYQWNFDFTFRVLRSLTPIFKYGGKASG